jgi:hypothetical protein
MRRNAWIHHPARPRRALLVVLALAAALAAPAIARAAGINLSWDDCGAAGSSLKSFTCATTSPPANLVASFEAPTGVRELLGLTGELRVAATSLPDWWKHGAGQCRGTNGMSVNFEPAGSACNDFWAGRAVGGISYEVGAYGPNTARLKVACAIPFDDRAPIPSEGQFYGFNVRIQPTRISGTGACAGCEDPVTVTLENIQLFQPPERAFDPVITQPLQGTTVHWQGVTGGTPAIASVVPGAGGPGTTVTIAGEHLDGAYAVRFGGVAAQFQVFGPTTITALVPGDARSGPITVETAFGTATSPAAFHAPPVLRGFLPAAGPVGFGVTIRGHNFARVSQVRFGLVPASFTVASDSVIHATVPAGAADGPIALEDPLGVVSFDRSFIVGPAQGGLNLSWNDCGLAGAALQAFACNTNSGSPFRLVGSFVPPAGVEQLVAIQSEVRIASTTLPEWWQFGPAFCRGAAALSASADFHDGACADPWNGLGAAQPVQFDLSHYGSNTARLRITTQIQGPTGRALDPGVEYDAFKLLLQPARTTGFGSCAGCDAPVTLSFEQARLVQAPAMAFDPVVTATLDRNVAWWQSQPGPPPVIASVNPTAGAPGATVTILGEHLGNATVVRFAGRPAEFTVVDDGELRATVPLGARTGQIQVTTPFGVASSGVTFLVAPELFGFAPHTAPAGYTIAIRGINFTGATSVTFNGLGAAFAVAADSLIRADVPPGAASGPIAVTTPAGTATSERSFTVGPLPRGGINLAWNDCGPAGEPLRSFACDDVSTVHELVASFEPPPGVEEFMGLRGVIRADFGAIPDWWRHGPTQCRAQVGLVASLDFGSAHTCLDPWQNEGFANLVYGIGDYGPNTASIGIVASLPVQNRRPLDSDREHYGFKVQLRSSHLNTCFGCHVPARLTLQEIQLVQPAGLAFDPILTDPLTGNVALWQGEPGPPPAIASLDPPAGKTGDVVRIVGEHLATTSRLTFRHGFFTSDQGVPFTVESDNVIVTAVPEDARSSAWEVTTRFGRTQSAIFRVAPDVRSFQPPRAQPGETVTVRGRNFVGTTAVTFGDVPAASFVVRDELELEAVVPLGAVDGPIRVTNPGGTDASALAFRVGPSIAGGVNLSWDDCGRAGADVKTFACDTNAGDPFTLVGSFVPPSGVFEFLGATATVDVRSQTSVLPDWWRMNNGACRRGRLSSSFDFTGDAWQSCLDFAQGRAAGGHSYEVELTGANTARLRLTWAVPFDARGELTAGHEYYAFQARIARAQTTGDGSCPGCEVPVEIALREIQLFQPPARALDPVLRTAVDNAIVLWQGQVGTNLGPNLARNPSFEVSTSDWRTVGNAALERVPGGAHGAWSAQITAHPDSGTTSFGLNDSPDTVPFFTGGLRTHRFEAWVRTSSPGTRAQLRIREYSSAPGRARLQTATSPWAGLTTEWQPLVADLTKLEGHSMLDFQVICDPASPGAVVGVDDVKIRILGSGPSITAPDVVDVVPGTPYEFEVSAEDPTGAPVTSITADFDGLRAFLVSQGPGRALVRYTPQPEDAGYGYLVRLRATSVLTTERAMRINVAPASPDPNLVSNPSFEQDLFGWKTYEGSSITRVANGRIGQWAMQVAGPDTAKEEFGVNDHPSWIRDTGPDPLGRPYRFTAWVRGVNGGGRVHWKVREYKDGVRIGSIVYSPKVELGADWRRVTVDFRSEAPGSFLDAHLVCTQAGGNAAFLVDDVMIRDLTPPSFARSAEATASRGDVGDVAFERPVVFPTPYRDRATLAMTLPARGKVTVELFDLHGRRVKQVADRELEAGTHRFDLDRRGDDGERLGAGMYFYRVRGAVIANGRVVMLD